MLKKLFSILFAVLLLGQTVSSKPQEQPRNVKAGQAYQTLQADLDGDGKQEKIGLVAYRVVGHHYWGQLTVWNRSGKVLWKAPESENSRDPFALGAYDENGAGPENLQFVGDLYGDGKIELLVPRSTSDLRPTTFRIFRWDGKAFVPVSEKLLIERKRGSGEFTWLSNNQIKSINDISTWVSSLEFNDGALLAQIRGFKGDTRKATMDRSAQGMQVRSWER